MDLLQQHKQTVIIGFICFAIGFFLGEYVQTKSFEQEMTTKIFNQVTDSHSKMRSRINKD